MSYKTQKRWENIGVAIVAVVLVLAIVALLVNVFNKNDDEFEKAYLSWSVGGLDESGAFVKNETDSLTSDPVKIEEGIRIVVGFDKIVTYNVALYDKNHIFVGYIAEATSENVTLTRAAIDDIEDGYEKAVYFRVTLIDIEEDDGYITWFEKQELKRYVKVYTCAEVEKVETTTAADEE